MDIEDNEFYTLLKEEQREMKKNLSGVRGRASRTGRVSSVKTAISFLQGKEITKYKNNSKVVSYNMYDQVIPYLEFIQLPLEKQKEVLHNWRLKFGAQHVKKNWDTPERRDGWRAYSLAKKWDLPIHTAHVAKRTPVEKAPEIIQDPEPTPPPVTTPSITGSIISLNKTTSGDDLYNRLLKIADYIDKDVEYAIQITITEMEQHGR